VGDGQRVAQRGVRVRGLQDREQPSFLTIEDPDVDHCRCGSDARWCARADALFKADGVHVLGVRTGRSNLDRRHHRKPNVSLASGNPSAHAAVSAPRVRQLRQRAQAGDA
jgi:hypothetical protein